MVLKCLVKSLRTDYTMAGSLDLLHPNLLATRLLVPSVLVVAPGYDCHDQLQNIRAPHNLLLLPTNALCVYILLCGQYARGYTLCRLECKLYNQYV